MKRGYILVITLLILSAISGYLLSKVSLLGRIGMSLIYTQYNFLKIWWQGALAVFIALMLLFGIQALIQAKVTKAVAVHIIMILLALAGLYAAYNDFRNSLTHRWLAERFHLGVYLFFIGWIIISLYFLIQKRKKVIVINNRDASN